MSDSVPSKRRYCDMDKLAMEICNSQELTEDEANKFIHMLWQQSEVNVQEVLTTSYEDARYTEGVHYQERCKACGKWTYEYGGKFCPYCGRRVLTQ